MRKGFFLRLAADNLKKNRRSYLPYLLSCIGTVAMFYIMLVLSKDTGIESMRGAEAVQTILMLGNRIVGIFAVIFLFYTNSFLLKNRKKEFGLFNILGMEKRHLAAVTFFESLYCAGICIGGGLALGILFSKLLYLILLKMLRGTAEFGFTVSGYGIRVTVLLFLAIFLVLYLNTLRQIQLSKPIELLRGAEAGEREPKTKAAAAIAGFLLMGAGYYIAITTESPLEALTLFFVAVAAVIAGTYLLFGAGSIFMLKMLRRRESFYYQPRHFISVSGMIYRMKQNAAGLASICVLSTGVLILISVSVSLYFGGSQALRIRYPRNIAVAVKNLSSEQCGRMEEQIMDLAQEAGISMENVMKERVLNVELYQETDGCFTAPAEGSDWSGNVQNLYLMTLEDYNGMMQEHAELEADEVILYVQSGRTASETLQFGKREWKVKTRISAMPVPRDQMSQLVHTAFVVFSEETALVEAVQAVAPSLTEEEIREDFYFWYAFDTDGDEEQQAAFTLRMNDLIREDEEIRGYAESVEEGRENMYAMYGGFLFIGVFLGLLFLMATVMIIYYKQVSEGYDDQARFRIMQKVGMSREEVKKAIHSQILMVFFLPLCMAGIHMLAAFPMLSRLMALAGLDNRRLLAAGCGITFAAFAGIYILVYAITARVYYQIVRVENE
ncbi:MAG: ABC transporter permease [Candidatus Limivivens sp.]|nr:ABC transporter permease [Candidatus Limivivens sp.]